MKWATFFTVMLTMLGPRTLNAQVKPEVSDDPEVERKLLAPAEGFELQLVAMEPEIINPVQINFDPQGRLWVLCIPRYPQLLPGQDPADFITVIDGIDPATGKAKKTSIFADGLTVPTGMAPGDGGVYVGQADKLLHLRDSNGQGKADQRRVLFAGFGTQDTHHTLNSFRWGPDGNLYFNQGIYIKSDVETPYGLRRHWGGGVWQLRPDRLKLEVYDRSILGNNTWGHFFDPWGRSFCTSAWPANVNLVLPDSPLNDGKAPETIPSLAMTKVADGRHCGATFIGGLHFPPEFQGNLVSGSFAQQLVYRYDIREAGSSFVGKQLAPLVTSKHRKFRPVDVQMGPDGALYIADWYDEVIQHNQIDFRDPRRDHSRGRIWRLVAKNRPMMTPPKLVGVSSADVLVHLKSPDPHTRQQAKRALAEQDANQVAAALKTWVSSLDANDPEVPRLLLEALWTSQSIDRVDVALLDRVLRSEEPRARAAACRVAGAWADRLESPELRLSAGAADVDPRVRLEAVLALGRIPSAQAVQVALGALDQPSDPLVAFALKRTVVLLRPYWYPEFQKGLVTFGGKAKHLAFALDAIRADTALPQLAMLLRANKIPEDSRPTVYGLFAEQGDVKLQGQAWDWVFDAATPTSAKVVVLDAFERAARAKKRPGEKLDRIAELFGDKDEPLALAAMRLAGAWRLESARTSLEKFAADVGERSRAAIAALVALSGPASEKTLLGFASDPHPYALRVRALAGLASLDAKKAALPASDLLKRPTSPGDDPSDLFAAFLDRAGGTVALLEALRKQGPSPDAAKIGLRVLNAQGVPAGPLHELLQLAANLGNVARKAGPEDVKRLLKLVDAQGDPARGEDVFRRAALGCLQCHAIGGAGGRVGPELNAIGASSQVDYLLESILFPDKVIREGYNTAHIITASGKAISGVVVRETPKDLVLRTTTADEVVIAKADIEERNSGGSLMPQGLATQLTDAELADLVRFLSQVGKPGPYAVSHVPTARRWKVLANVPASIATQDLVPLGPKLREDPTLVWNVAFSRINGELPLLDIKSEIAIIECQLDVILPGAITLKINGYEGLTLYVDGKMASLSDRTALTLSRGTHTLAFRVLRQRGIKGIVCELADTPGSTAQAVFVGGR